MLDNEIRDQIRSAYMRMDAVGYRPGARSDGCGNLIENVSDDPFGEKLEAEVAGYGARWWAEEDAGEYVIGSPHFPHREAMILTIEAARLMCAGKEVRPLALRVLGVALEAMNDVAYLGHWQAP